jgi:chemotaxis protein methyltransferase CheR
MSTTIPLPECERVLEFAGAHMGLAFSALRRGDALRVVHRAMSAAGEPSGVGYCARLRANSRDYDDFVSALTVGETYFFREPAHFEFVRQTVIPSLLLRPAAEGPIRVWSAGCSSGEEAYSLAMSFADSGLAGRTHILATDVSRAALARADAGVYRDWSLRGEAAARCGRWLRRQGDAVRVDPALRRMITWEYLNLAVDVYPALATRTWALDLIFCRNVLIYFDADTIRRVGARFFAALAPGGWLVTASSDPSLSDFAPWHTEVTPHGVFYLRPGADRAPRAPLSGWTGNGREPQDGPEPQQTVRDEIGLSEEADWREADPVSPAPGSGGSVPALDDLPDCLARIPQLANESSARAVEFCAEAIARHPLSAALHVLHAILLEELGRTEAAVAAGRRAVYLDRSLAMGHFTLGVSLQRHGQREEARKAFRNARDLCRARPDHEPVPLAEGETSARLAAAASVQMAILESKGDDTQVASGNPK